VSVESNPSIAGWEGVSSAMQEIRDCHAETWAFFHGLFEELNLFSISLDAHKRHLAQSVFAAAEKPQADCSAFDEKLSELFTQREAEREEIRETREAVRAQVTQLSTVATELASAQNAFQTNFQLILEELANSREASAHEAAAPAPASDANGELQKKLLELEREHAALEQDRAVLEKELEGVRNRAADLAELLAEQKRLATQAQSQGATELQRMRQLLENLARQEAFARHDHADPGEAAVEAVVPLVAKQEPAAAAADPVLGSVLAQFEMLQQDRARRRA
jgi:chromosome segregation ATPase